MEERNLQNREHWVFKKHTNNIDILVDVAMYLKEKKSGISSDEKKELFRSLQENSVYSPRKSARNMPLDSINHRIDELSYYMFGYTAKIEKSKKFIFSPLGNLFLNNIDDKEKTSKIFSTMLTGIQFPHPASKPSEEFYLYPFRLIFELLLDKRLDGKLYNYEIYQHLIYIKEMTPKIYQQLVNDILISRHLTSQEKYQNLKDVEGEIVKSVYEWEYYVLRLLSSQGIFVSYEGDFSGKLYHPVRDPETKKTGRRVTDGFFTLSEQVKPFIQKLLVQYPLFSDPLKMSDDKRQTSEIIKEIYSFYPDVLLEELGEKVTELPTEILRLPKLIEEYALNEDGKTFDKFEDVLEDAFNLFYNVEAEKLSGAGRTDIECVYLPLPEKFSVEAKSTSNKLPSLNAGRLAHHRELIGARYTIVVTPRYVPSVKYDIKGQDIVIIKANTLSEYIYNYLNAGIREIDYTEILDIIQNNLGKDISLEVSERTLMRFG